MIKYVKNILRSAGQDHLGLPIVLLIIFIVIVIFRSPEFFTAHGIAGAIIVAAPLILSTLALTPIVLAGRGGVDLAVGPLLAFINITLILWVVNNNITHPVLVFSYVIVAGVLFQLLQGVIVVYARVPPIIVSLSGYLVLSGLNLVILEQPTGHAPQWMASWGAGTAVFSPVFFILVSAFIVWAIFSRSAFFRHLKMMGFDERTAYTSGVNINAVRLGAYAIAGFYAGLAALSYTALICSADPIFGNAYTLLAITALVLGGTSLVGGKGGGLGSVLGAIIMYMITCVLSTFHFGLVSGFVTQMVYGVILILSFSVSMLSKRGATDN